MKILVVDDYKILADLFGQVIGASGHEVRVAYSPQEALNILKGGFRPEILLSDTQMPDMSGIELAEVVEEMVPGVKIVLMSGNLRLPEEVNLKPGWLFFSKTTPQEMLHSLGL